MSQTISISQLCLFSSRADLHPRWGVCLCVYHLPQQGIYRYQPIFFTIYNSSQLSLQPLSSNLFSQFTFSLLILFSSPFFTTHIADISATILFADKPWPGVLFRPRSWILCHHGSGGKKLKMGNPTLTKYKILPKNRFIRWIVSGVHHGLYLLSVQGVQRGGGSTKRCPRSGKISNLSQKDKHFNL